MEKIAYNFLVCSDRLLYKFLVMLSTALVMCNVSQNTYLNYFVYDNLEYNFQLTLYINAIIGCKQRSLYGILILMKQFPKNIKRREGSAKGVALRLAWPIAKNYYNASKKTLRDL